MQQSWGSDFERTADSRNQQQTDQDKPQNGAWGRGVVVRGGDGNKI